MIKFTSVPSKRLAASITAAATSLQLNNILGWDGEALVAGDFGTELYAVLRNDANTQMELIELDPDTIASASVTIVRRGLDFNGDLTTEVSANKLVWVKNDTIVELGADTPQMLQAIKEYADAIANAGAADASVTTKGLLESATTAEIDAGTATGATGAELAVTPDKLAASVYSTRLPSSVQKTFLDSVVGMVVPYAGSSAPTGFLLCDGSAIDMDTYPALAAVLLGKYGYSTAVTFTADAGTDVITANSHGLANGTILLVKSTTTLPAGLSVNTLYYVINQTTNTFQLSTTSGGSAVNITDTGTGTHSFYNSILLPDIRGRVIVGMGTGSKVYNLVTADVNVDDTIAVESNTELQTGQAVLFDTTGVAPTGLTTATTYYVVRQSATSIKLASSLANAQNGTVIDITAQGTGPHTLTHTLTARTLADAGGEETHAMSSTELLAHTHPPLAGSGYHMENSGSETGGSTGTSTAATTGSTGGNAAMNNMQPFLTLNYIIKT